MKLITLYVANKLDHVVDFDAEKQLAVESYIIERKDVGEPADLFAFYHSIEASSSDSIAIHHQKSKKQEQDNGNEILFQSNKGKSTLCIQQISAKKADNVENEKNNNELNVINIEIIFSSDKNESEIKTDGLKEIGLTFDKSDQNLWVMSLDLDRNQQNPVIINLSLKLKQTNPNRELDQDLKLCVAKKTDIEDVVLDFGSEASQTASYIRNDRQTERCIHSLFNEMKALLSSNSMQESIESPNETSQPVSTPSATENNHQSAAESYVQEDNDIKLFKSIFYAQKSISNQDDVKPVPELLETGKLQENKVLKMLTTQMQAQNLIQGKRFIQMPNVKIIQFGGVNQPKISLDGREDAISDFKNGFFYRASINHFILNALLQARKPCISLYVLMPNVYSPLSVIKHLKWIREDIQNLISSNSQLQSKIKAVELSAVSESDASLLGAISIIQDNSFSGYVKPGNYIIVDAGKGTLDFSAIKYEKTDEGPRIHSIYRSGIIGAGNTLTYAYLFALLAEYMNSPNSKFDQSVLLNYVYENILGGTTEGQGKGGGDLADILELMQAVERYKIRIGTKNSKADNWINADTLNNQDGNFSEIQMTKITEFINKMAPEDRSTYKPLSSKAQKFVTNTINQIVNDVYKHLYLLKIINYGKIDGVIFAGRGFSLPEFKSAMKKKLCDLQKQLTDGETTDISELTYMGNDLKVNEKNVCLYIRNAIQNGHYNNHMTSIPVKLQFDNSQIEDSSKKKDQWIRFQEWLGMGREKTNEKKNINMGYVVKAIFSSRDDATYQTPGDTRENGMVDGYTINLANSDEKIMIGGTIYPIEKKGDVTIFFTNEKIIYRYLSRGRWRIDELAEKGVDVRISPLIFGTLFPNVEVTMPQQVCFPYDSDLDQYGDEVDKQKGPIDNADSIDKDENPQHSEQNLSSGNSSIGQENGNLSATDRAHQLADEI